MRLLSFITLLVTTAVAGADPAATALKCRLLETADNFWYYQEQQVYQSPQFVLFENFLGRVQTQVNIVTSEMIRTSYIGDPYPTYQILYGRCDNTRQTLLQWQSEQVQN
ncbi:hypothetical protein [Vibrio sp.]|uniref:hypothetical protein n=1 Tax=Vibrio sp. TaxID=678 RepID=UPI003D097017